MVRAVAATLAERGLRDRVVATVSSHAGALLLDPPLPTEWLDARLLNEIYEVLRGQVGDAELRKLNREAVKRGVSPLIRAAAESLLRTFGVSPATLLARLDRVAGTSARGIIYHYEPIDDVSGHFEIDYPTLRDVPLGPFVATAGALEDIFEMCNVRGTIDALEVVQNGRQNRMRCKVSWARPAK
jgi:hypothetical protein